MLMPSSLPLSVTFSQPHSVRVPSYRIRMVSDLKKIIRDNTLQLVQKATGPLKPRESGVTRLVAMGISNGTAQRILDDDSDLRLETVEQLAAALKVTPVSLMTPDAKAPAMLFRDLNPFEVMLMNLFRDLTDEDEQHAAIVELNQRRDRARSASASPAADAGNPYANAGNRRHLVQGRTPERRAPDPQARSPLTHNDRRAPKERKA